MARWIKQNSSKHADEITTCIMPDGRIPFPERHLNLTDIIYELMHRPLDS